MTQDELIEIDPNATEFYKPNDPDNEEDDTMDALNDENEDETTERYANVPPFEVHSTPVGYGTGTTRVTTRAMCIKSTVKHGKLLSELLLRMKINPNAFPSIKYIPVGMATNIGSVPYMNLIQQNNVYLTSVATIAVAGIPDKALNLEIPVHQTDNRKTQTLREILMATDWCTQIEPTQTPGRILLITTKSNLDHGRQWLDDNLPPLFTIFLPKNPKFIPDTDNPVAHRIDMRNTNKTLADYTEALCQHIKPITAKANAPTPYARPPPPKTNRLVPISFAQAVKSNLRAQANTAAEQGRKKKARNADGTSVTTDTSSDITQASTATTNIQNLKDEILNTVRQEIANLLKADLTPLHNEIKTVQQTLTTKIDQQNTVMHQFQEKLTSAHEHFQEQIQKDYIRMQNHQKQIQHDHNNLQRQMEAFFTRFAQIPTSFQPPSGHPEGGER